MIAMVTSNSINVKAAVRMQCRRFKGRAMCGAAGADSSAFGGVRVHMVHQALLESEGTDKIADTTLLPSRFMPGHLKAAKLFFLLLLGRAKFAASMPR